MEINIPSKELWITKLNDNAQLPVYKTNGSVCADLYLPEDIRLLSRNITKVPLGLIFKIDPQYHIEIYIRSSLALRGIILANSVGIIDSDYCGPEDEVALLIYNVNCRSIDLEKGSRIAQLKIVPNIRFNLMEVSNEALAKRSRRGFGSTGK